jgi:hypothetical protein
MLTRGPALSEAGKIRWSSKNATCLESGATIDAAP